MHRRCRIRGFNLDIGKPVVALVGSPNVGKSMLFYRLTGKYAWVSNYPGTTVDVTIGETYLEKEEVVVVDTPGVHSLIPVTEEERVTLRVLLEAKPKIVVHVVEARSIREMLPLTLMLLDAGLNLVLAVNAVDEARKAGFKIDFKRLEEALGVPVIPTVATTGEGVDRLRKAISECLSRGRKVKLRIQLPEDLEEKIKVCEKLLEREYSLSKRFLSILALIGEKDVLKIISEKEERGKEKLVEFKALKRSRVELLYVLSSSYQRLSNSLFSELGEVEGLNLSDKISELMVKPVTGIPLLLLTLLLFYLFVGLLGAQVVVDLLEKSFERYVNSTVNSLLEKYLPYLWIYELIGGEYGIITLGLRYAFSIILPVVSFFFIAFSLLEDIGYLPRLAMLTDNLLRRIGLSGKAIIPLVLGLGCDTMATLTTRTLENEKERLLVVILLALGVPCSAQLGVIMGLLPSITSLLIWGIIVLLMLLAVGYSASKLLPGATSFFIIELPPLRTPRLENILLKTWVRLEWYLREVLPLFILASILIWAGRLTGLFDLAISALALPTTWIGLPEKAAVAFLYGFFRRDYGAAGFFDLRSIGLLGERQTLVAMVTITLFVPCIAQFSAMIRERGTKTALMILLLIIPLAFLVGYLTNLLVMLLGGLD